MNETAKYSWNLLEFKQTTLNKRLAVLALQACCAVISFQSFILICVCEHVALDFMRD